MRKLAIALAASYAAAGSLFAATDLTISEFMASNVQKLADEDGFYADWIEIRNHTDAPVNLLNWSLTDSSSNPTKWRFPATNIPPQGYMVVFADGKDRRVPGAPLHTSFSLSASGEYLALIRPNGTIANQFSPAYPPQAPDVSYGYGLLTSNVSLITTSTLVRVRVPASGAEGVNWTAPGYDDSAWQQGTNGVGYASPNAFTADYGAVVMATSPVGYWRLDEASGSVSANRGSGGASLNASYVGGTLGTPGPRPPAYNGFETNNNAPTFASSHVTVNNSLLSGRSAFTVAGWIHPTVTPGARVGLFGQNDAVEFGFSAVGTLQCWTPGGGSVNASWTLPNNIWVHVVAVGDGSSLRVFTNGVLAASGGSATANYGASSFPFNIGGNGIFDTTGNNFTGLIDEVAVYHRALSVTEITNLYSAGLNPAGASIAEFVRTDISSSMSNINASAYVRIPFVIAHPTNIALMTMRMRYDDGLVAYVNGVEVLRANAPNEAALAYNAAATNSHSGSLLEEFRFGTNGLVAGTNILAIHGLNTSANDVDFLIAPQLTASTVAADSSVPVYFTAPSPGAPNVGGVSSPGPSIVESGHNPNVPLDSQDLIVTAKVVPTFYSVSNVIMRYRVMFDAEIEVPMFDDGMHGDGATNDGVFGATIPASAATNGQMIRWFFRAADVRGNVSRWPLFTDPADTAEYLGTIVEPGVTSKLDVIHLFAPANVLSPGPTSTQTGADSQGGARVSLFFDGEFYDNVHMELRGNSTSGFNKKSHRVEFNREHPFRHNQSAERIRKTSFVADWPDPTYMRQGLSYWLCDVFGAPAPFYAPVRLQLNGRFYQLANHNDLHGEELLTRIGYDPNGALYNAAGQVTPSKASTGGFDKKTRTWEGDADYLDLANKIAETVPAATRATNVFDLFDLPEMLNYLVVARFVHENDDIWANLSLYYDNDGDRLWRIVPFDMNLSWGAIFAEGDASLYTGVQATNDTHKSHPLYGGANILARSGPAGAFNRVYDAIFQNPVTRQMFLRRMRTLLDTWVKPIGTPTNSTFIEQKILAHRDLIAEEAVRDRAWWGWPAVGGQNNFAPGIDITNGVNQLLEQFFRARRQHFYGRHSVTNTALPIGITSASNAGIPLAQPENVELHISQFEYSPSSGNQGHEFIQLTNPNPYAVDISGWTLDGAVEFTFKPGTVVPSNSVVYVVPDMNAFRTRTTTPRPGQALFVVGGYKGNLSARGETIVLTDGRNRIVSTNSYPGNPTPAQQYLRITEVMYNPAAGPAGSYDTGEYEYIELKNIGSAPLSLVGVYFTNGITFAFTSNSAVTTLGAGQRVVLVKNAAAFNSRYPGQATIAGVYGGSLDNSGERLRVLDAVGEEILDFEYNNTWYPITDGLGFSLVIVDDTAPFNTWNEKQSWRPSGTVSGSPGTVDPIPGTFAAVVVNEILANSTAPAVDFIELRNTSATNADVGNWYISDDFFTPKKFRIPAGTTIAPGGYISFTEAQFNSNPSAPTSFGFSADGDEAYLFAADAAGNLLGYFHGFSFNNSADGVSFGRHVTSVGDEHFVAQTAVTRDGVNSGPLVGPIVISEVMYRPSDDSPTANQLEFIEIRNISANPVGLFDAAFPTNTWKLRDGIGYTFKTNTVLAPGGNLLIVGFDPEVNAFALSRFRTVYGLDASVAVVGPFAGDLQNSNDDVELARPLPPTTNDVDFVLVDKVDYFDSAPWPIAADGFGASLQRIVLGDYGNDPTNWVAAVPTPGGARSTTGTAPVISAHPQDLVTMIGQPVSLSVEATGPNLRFQWKFNGINLPGQTNAVLTFTSPDRTNSGIYQVAVLNEAGAAISSEALLSVLQPIYFAAHPGNQRVNPGVTFNLTASAVGNGPVAYQWRFNGAPITGATNSTLTLTNAELYEHSGYYDVTANDAISSATSATAAVVVLAKPVVTNAPVATRVLAGGTAVFRVIAGPIHPMLPLTNTWAMFQNVGMFTNTAEAVFYIFNCTNNGFVRLRVANAAGQTNITAGLNVTVLADADRDGMADAWEVQYGFATNSVADATLDLDGDGHSNRDEYVAGTKPTDALSVLRLTLSPTNQALLQFVAESNISYTIQHRSSLSDGVWQTMSNVPAINGPARVLPFWRGTNSLEFYRVTTPEVFEP